MCIIQHPVSLTMTVTQTVTVTAPESVTLIVTVNVSCHDVHKVMMCFFESATFVGCSLVIITIGITMA